MDRRRARHQQSTWCPATKLVRSERVPLSQAASGLLSVSASQPCGRGIPISRSPSGSASHAPRYAGEPRPPRAAPVSSLSMFDRHRLIPGAIYPKSGSSPPNCRIEAYWWKPSSAVTAQESLGAICKERFGEPVKIHTRFSCGAKSGVWEGYSRPSPVTPITSLSCLPPWARQRSFPRGPSPRSSVNTIGMSSTSVT